MPSQLTITATVNDDGTIDPKSLAATFDKPVAPDKMEAAVTAALQRAAALFAAMKQQQPANG